MKRALTAYEDTNMYGGAHVTNYETAKRAMDEGRDLVIHWRHYDGQRYSDGKSRVTDLREENGNVVGRIVGRTEYDTSGTWEATKELCEYAKTGRM